MLVSADIDGIHQAALELFRAAIDEKSVESRLRLVQADDVEQIAKLVPRSRLAPGYHEWTLYLLWLEASGLDAEFADELEGITAIRRARRDFEEENPRCVHCGARVKRGRKHFCPEMARAGGGQF